MTLEVIALVEMEKLVSQTKASRSPGNDSLIMDTIENQLSI